MLILKGFSLYNQRQTSFMAPLPGIEKIEYINILTKEGNATLDIFLKFYKRKDQTLFYKQWLYKLLIFRKPY